MNQIRTIIPVSVFKKSTQEFLSRIELMNEPLMLTLYGRGAFVVQHINSYINLTELASLALHQRAVEGALDQLGSSGD